MGHSRDSQHIMQNTEGRQTKQKYNIQSLKEEQRESHQIPDDEPVTSERNVAPVSYAHHRATQIHYNPRNANFEKFNQFVKTTAYCL